MPVMPDFVAYYRVSTDRQGESGLGLDAQRAAVARHLGAGHVGAGRLVAEFQEVESGRRHTNRPQLAAAVALCRRTGATLLIARLDRLARNVAFVAGLMDSGVEFVAADMPHANRLTVHILAAVAEHERELISQRTRAALAEARKRGTRLGNPRWQDSLPRARAARQIAPPPPNVVEIMREQREKGRTLRAIADHLNGLGIPSPRGGRWYNERVRAILARQPREGATA